jgi:hypothetical protein
MPSRTQDKIYETFVAVARGQSTNQHSMIDASERIAKPGARTGAPISTAKAVKWRAAELATPSRPASGAGTTGTTSTTGTPGSTGSSSAQSLVSTVLQSVFQSVPLAGAVAGVTSTTGGGGIGNTIESIASTVLKSGLGIIPLIGGLLGLFGGGGSPAPPALTKYVMPSSIAFEGTDAGPGVSGADYDQMGLPRTYSGSGGSGSAGLTPLSGTSETGSGGTIAAFGDNGSIGGSNVPAPPTTVDAQPMDTRWFLDHSSDIAAAVRYAMLNSHSINDVVNEL